jgi:hypothetical protein
MNTLAFERLLAVIEAVVDQLRDLNENLSIIKDLLNARLNLPAPLGPLVPPPPPPAVRRPR